MHRDAAGTISANLICELYLDGREIMRLASQANRSAVNSVSDEMAAVDFATISIYK